MNTNKSIIIGIVFLLALVAIYFLIYGNPYANNYGTPPANNNSTTTQTNIGTNAVSIKNFVFSPSTLTIPKGTTVTWTNEDSTAHEIKSNTFNSSLLSQGGSFSFTFDQVGTFNYSCAIHPSMQGKIIVQ